MRTEDVYGEPVVMQFENCTAYVYHPILTPEERERRIERIKRAAIELLIEEERVNMEMEKKAKEEAERNRKQSVNCG